MDCPKCGRPRVPGDECPHCGIVYAKFRPAAAEHLVAPPPPPARKGPWIAAAVAIVAAVGVTAIVVVRAKRADRDQVEGAPGAATAPAPLPAPDPGASAQGSREPGPSPGGGPAPEPESCATYSPDGIGSGPSRPTASATWYEGASGFRHATEEQSSSGAPLLALFYTDWCPHCRRFAAEVIPSAEMRELGERVVKVKVNAEGSGDDRDLATKYAVRSYPTLLVIATPGAAPVRVGQWGSPRAFVESCERALPNRARDHLAAGISLSRSGRPEQAAAELKAAASDPKLSALALDHLGALALAASCFERAVAIYGRVLEADPTYQGGRVRYLRGLAYFRRGDRERALEDAEGACRLGFREACPVAERLRGSAR